MAGRLGASTGGLLRRLQRKKEGKKSVRRVGEVVITAIRDVKQSQNNFCLLCVHGPKIQPVPKFLIPTFFSLNLYL